MIRWVISALGYLLLTCAALAQVGQIPAWPPTQFIASGGVTFSAAWVSHAEDTVGGSPITYSALSFGVADVNRVIVVQICNRAGATSALIASVTIGGISATQVSGALADTGGTGLWVSDMWQATVPTGTSGNVVVTYANSSTRSAVDLYRIVTATKTATAAVSAQNAATSAGLTSPSITVPVGGVAISIFGSRGPASGTDVTWTNATKDFSAIQFGGAATASAATTTASGSTTISGVIGGSGSTAVVLSVAAWGP